MERRFWDRAWVEAVQIALNVLTATGAMTGTILVGKGVVGAWLIGVVVGCGLLVAFINHASHGPDDELPDF